MTTAEQPASCADAPTTLEDRATDLLSRMTVPEKVGMMFHFPISFRSAEPGHPGHAEALAEIERLIRHQHIRHFNVRGAIKGAVTPRVAAEWLNEIQRIAAGTRLGIPVSISSDPRHGFANHPGTTVAGYLSQWPEPIGLAAARSPELVRRFADTVRQEYRAIGIQVALHPQADLATEPRWMRTSGTFGQDAGLVSELITAYIQGMQGGALGPDSVACMTKHFPGGGPQEDGEDPHFSYGKNQTYRGGFFNYHLQPFRAAIAAGTAQLMPYYGRPIGLGLEEIGFAFNAEIIRGLLREELGFDGVVCSDWGILSDTQFEDMFLPAIAWGAEELDVAGRIMKALDAGVDQFGGESCTDELLELVASGRVPEQRLDVSVRRLLRDKLALGLFEQPFADRDRAAETTGRADFVAAGFEAQRRSVTVLKNGKDGHPVLPLAADTPCRFVGFQPGVAGNHTDAGAPGSEPITLIRTRAPYEPRAGGFERFHRAGRLDFTAEELADLRSQMSGTTVIAIELDRPAVMPELLAEADAVISFCGASDEALLDVIFGRAQPEGRLPFDLPRSMTAVEQHPPDEPGGTADPVLRYGWGLDLSRAARRRNPGRQGWRGAR